jgi:hypothetical protein
MHTIYTDPHHLRNQLRELTMLSLERHMKDLKKKKKKRIKEWNKSKRSCHPTNSSSNLQEAAACTWLQGRDDEFNFSAYLANHAYLDSCPCSTSPDSYPCEYLYSFVNEDDISDADCLGVTKPQTKCRQRDRNSRVSNVIVVIPGIAVAFVWESSSRVISVASLLAKSLRRWDTFFSAR